MYRREVEAEDRLHLYTQHKGVVSSPYSVQTDSRTILTLYNLTLLLMNSGLMYSPTDFIKFDIIDYIMLIYIDN